jgi:hypothetical protein
MSRATVIVHERLGNWNRQLRPRLQRYHARWFESRSAADRDGLLGGLAFPVILIDLGRHPADGLTALSIAASRSPEARSLVLDPEATADVPALARELGATHVYSGYVPPPLVAGLLARWITIARDRIALAGWSRTTFPETATDPWYWLSDYLGEPGDAAEPPPAPRLRARPILQIQGTTTDVRQD